MRTTGSRRRCAYLFTNTGLFGVNRRINEHCVFTHQASVRPRQFEQEIQVGFTKRLTGRNVNNQITIRPRNHLKFQFAKKLMAFQANPLIGIFRCHVDEDITGINPTTLPQSNFCIQRLIQPRLHLYFAQPQGLSHTGAEPSRQRQGNRKLAYLHAFSFPVSVIL